MICVECQGKDDKGGYVFLNIFGVEMVNLVIGGVVDGGKVVGGKMMDGVKGVGSYVGGMFGGGKNEEQK